MLKIPKMILIGSTAKDAGKTTFVTQFIKQFVSQFESKTDLYGVKSTVARGMSTQSGYKIQEEVDSSREKDTSKMLRSGCKKVYWLKCDEDHAEEGINEVLKLIPKDQFIICESNTIRNFIEPDIFIMIEKDGEDEWKETAIKIKDKVDLFVKSSLLDGEVDFSPAIGEIVSITDKGWVLK